MKKIINIKTGLWLLIALFAVSCANEEGALYENPESAMQVSFASAVYNNASLTPEDGTEINIRFQRNIAKGALDVPLSFKSSSALVTIDRKSTRLNSSH